jgi:hypothetical protein
MGEEKKQERWWWEAWQGRVRVRGPGRGVTRRKREER